MIQRIKNKLSSKGSVIIVLISCIGVGLGMYYINLEKEREQRPIVEQADDNKEEVTTDIDPVISEKDVDTEDVEYGIIELTASLAERSIYNLEYKVFPNVNVGYDIEYYDNERVFFEDDNMKLTVNHINGGDSYSVKKQNVLPISFMKLRNSDTKIFRLYQHYDEPGQRYVEYLNENDGWIEGCENHIPAGCSPRVSYIDTIRLNDNLEQINRFEVICHEKRKGGLELCDEIVKSLNVSL